MAAQIENVDLAKQEEWLETLEEELRSVQEQVNLSSKRNSVEAFSSLKNKVFLCGRYDYILKLIVGCTEGFVTKRRIELNNDFGREDYPGATGLKEKLAETVVVRRLNQKSQLLQEFVKENKAIFNRYEAELHAEQFAMSEGTVDAVQNYLVELRGLHATADTLLAIYLKLHERAMISRNAVQLLDSFNQEQD